MSGDIDSNYKNMLLDLSYLIDDDDLGRIKFRCDKIIRKVRKISTFSVN